ncbi:HlyD family efflux transporter periplasmic adaptor subunit [Phototrophicus methaneseepsis]|uniref:HlyD family efflux transporter periplasmic adaptor subunit n=1 Tax=Phototrophicus methaneseepsis TaxID=2710758 RepID=A0A7S8E6X1_9CHLR|nr:HlyD family efflux transporter periplasmic adaptor subunit [Phototrophicus methaneseepsis]QPC81467.1 HlyD family efflux transporter periplasmic adaptor subunit [Phototrophicus methaneseepsis]
MLYFLIILVITYLVYRLVIRRLRWRPLRFLVGVPVLTLVVLGVSVIWGLTATTARTERANQALEVLDEAVVDVGELRVTITSTGQILPNRQVALAFAVTGLVTDVLVEEGERVEAGQTIARLDAADLARLVDQGTIAVDLQQAAYDAMTSPPREADIAVAQAALDAAQAQYYAAASTAPSSFQEEIARLQTEIARNRLWQVQLSRDSISDPSLTPNLDANTGNEDVDDAIGDINDAINAQNAAQVAAIDAQRRQAEANINQVDYGVAIADANYESVLSQGADYSSVTAANAAIVQAEIALDNLINGPDPLQLQLSDIDLQQSNYSLQLAEYNLSQSELYAPFAGIIVQNNYVIGQEPPQGVGALLIDDSAYYVDLPIDEVDIVRVKVGQEVILRVDALPDTELSAEVVRVAYTPTQIGQLVVYNVRVRLNDTAEPIRVGMSVTGDLIVQDKPDVIIVPNRFVRIDRLARDAFVTVRTDDNTYEERLVLLGERNDIESEILAGLEAGETVVLLPQTGDGGLGLIGGQAND